MATSSPPDFYYTLESYEPAIQVEFYLPQPAIGRHLKKILGPGFNHEFVRKHFLGKDGNLTSTNCLKVFNFIRRDSSSPTSKEKVKQAVDRLKNIAWGYSMYTVKGAWSADTSQKPVEESTDVIRAIFRFDSSKLIEKLSGVQNGKFKEKKLEIRETIEKAIQSHPNLPIPRGDTQRKVFETVRQWQGDITFFLRLDLSNFESGKRSRKISTASVLKPLNRRSGRPLIRRCVSGELYSDLSTPLTEIL